MNEEQNLPEEKSTDNSAQATNENNAIELPTTNHKLPTEMEIHHPHHVTHKKKWTEYLLEFLMLFLAVFLGFIAENYREKIVEDRKGKHSMISLINDLKSDTANIQQNIEMGTFVSKVNDTLINLIYYSSPDTIIPRLYRLYIESNHVVLVNFEDRTSSQLKNSGGMQFIHKEKVADSIRSYWQQIKITEFTSSRLSDMSIKAADLAYHIFNQKYNGKRNPENPFTTSSQIAADAKLMFTDPEILIEFANRKNTGLAVLYSYLINLKKTKGMAARLIDLIKKEYHLENE